MTRTTLDLSGLKCPLPVLRTRKALLAMSAGERLEVQCTDPMAAIDIPNLVRQTGDRLEVAGQEAGRYTFLIVEEWSDTVTSTPWPTELRLSADRRLLSVTFDSGDCYDLSAELLRVTSPSAEVQGHAPSERKTVGGKRNVTILAIDPVGNYAVRLSFDDGHSTGLYTWAYLHALGAQAPQRFDTYLAELAAKGLSRDAPGTR